MTTITQLPATFDINNYKYCGEKGTWNNPTKLNGNDKCIIAGKFTGNGGDYACYIKIPDYSSLPSEGIKSINLVLRRPDVPTGYDGKIRFGCYQTNDNLPPVKTNFIDDDNFTSLSETYYPFGQNKYEEIRLPINQSQWEDLYASKFIILYSNPTTAYSYADFCVSTQYYPHLEIEYDEYSACTPPDEIAIDNEVILSMNSVPITWSGASGGTGIDIAGYNIYYMISNEQNNFDGVKTVNIEDISIDDDTHECHYELLLPESALSLVVQNTAVQIQIQTLGDIDGYDSEISEVEANAVFGIATPTIRIDSNNSIVIQNSNYYTTAEASIFNVLLYVPFAPKIDGQTHSVFIYSNTSETYTQLTSYNQWVNYSISISQDEEIVELQLYYMSDGNYLPLSSAMSLNIYRVSPPTISATFNPAFIGDASNLLTYTGSYTALASSILNRVTIKWYYRFRENDNDMSEYQEFVPNSNGLYDFYSLWGRRSNPITYQIQVVATDQLGQMIEDESLEYHYPRVRDQNADGKLIMNMTISYSDNPEESQSTYFSNRLYYSMRIAALDLTQEAPYRLRAVYAPVNATSNIQYLTNDASGILINSDSQQTIGRILSVNLDSNNTYYLGIQIMDFHGGVQYELSEETAYEPLAIPIVPQGSDFNISKDGVESQVIYKYIESGSTAGTISNLEYIIRLPNMPGFDGEDFSVFNKIKLWNESSLLTTIDLSDTIPYIIGDETLRIITAPYFFHTNGIPDGTALQVTNLYLTFENILGASSNQKIYLSPKRSISFEAIAVPDMSDADVDIYLDPNSTPQYNYNPGENITIQYEPASNLGVAEIESYIISIGLSSVLGQAATTFRDIGRIRVSEESGSFLKTFTLPYFLTESYYISQLKLTAYNNKNKQNSKIVTLSTNPGFTLNRLQIPTIEKISVTSSDPLNLSVSIGDHGGNGKGTGNYRGHMSGNQTQIFGVIVKSWDDNGAQQESDIRYTYNELHDVGMIIRNLPKVPHHSIQIYPIIGLYDESKVNIQEEFVDPTSTYFIKVISNTAYSISVPPYNYTYYSDEPLVSYRQHHLGINKAMNTPSTSDNEPIVYLQGYQNYNSIVLHDVASGHEILIDLSDLHAHNLWADKIDDGALS